MNQREMLMRRISSAQFAAAELRIFLDTHPTDQEALRSFGKYTERFNKLKREYESAYGPITSQDAFGDNRWTWVKDPWPWEYVDSEGER